MGVGDITIPNLSVAISISGKYQKEWDIGGNIVDTLSISLSNALTNGTGSNNANLFFRDRRSVTAGAPDDIDLAGSLTDIFGQSLTFVEIAGMAIYNRSTTAAEKLEVGGDAGAAFETWVKTAGDVIIVPAGGLFLLTAPIDGDFTVTAGTDDILQIVSASGTISYDILIWGRSA